MTKDPHYQREADKYERPVASREYLLELINQQKAPTSLEHLIELLGYSDENDIEGLRRDLLAITREDEVDVAFQAAAEQAALEAGGDGEVDRASHRHRAVPRQAGDRGGTRGDDEQPQRDLRVSA